MYSDLLLDHFQRPRNVGELSAPAFTVEANNPACGDILRLSVLFEGGRAAAARYKVRGCTASIAAGSALTEWISGKSADQLAAFQASFVERALGGLEAESKHAAVLCADAVKLLLKQAAPTEKAVGGSQPEPPLCCRAGESPAPPRKTPRSTVVSQAGADGSQLIAETL